MESTWITASTTAADMIVLGKEQFITLAVVLGVGVSILIFLLKYTFDNITKSIKANTASTAALEINLKAEMAASNKELQLNINKSIDKTNERIDKLEARTEDEIANIKRQMGDIKGDFATSFVQREDFFRVTNKMEDAIREQSRKLDQNVQDQNKKLDQMLLMLTKKD